MNVKDFMIISNEVDVDYRKLFKYKGFRWGWGCIVTSQKGFFFSKNGRGLGFSDTKGR